MALRRSGIPHFVLWAVLLSGCGREKALTLLDVPTHEDILGLNLPASASSISSRFDTCFTLDPEMLVTYDPSLFLARVYEHPDGGRLPYRLFIPPVYDETERYPLVVYLHGSSGMGTDNISQISGSNAIGSHVFTTTSIQDRYPCFVLAPQTQTEWAIRPYWLLAPDMRLFLDLIEDLEIEFSIDSRRLYATGFSLGGFGAWDLISKTRRFAASVPLAASAAIGGSMSPTEEEIRRAAPVLRERPYWFFYGEYDSDGLLKDWWTWMKSEIEAVGGTPKYTEYAGGSHTVPKCAYTEPGLYAWLFSQRLPE